MDRIQIHVGLQRLLELRGLTSFELYQRLRDMILFASLRMRKLSILARAEWKTALRAYSSAEEMQQQDLYDILADGTVLAAEHDSILADSELDLASGTNQRDQLKRRALTILTHLRAWRERWESDPKNACCETSPAVARLELLREAREDEAPPFLTIFQFSNESASPMSMLYNTALINVLQVLASLPIDHSNIYSNQGFIQETLHDTRCRDCFWEHSKDKYTAAERLAALQICLCIPYHSLTKSRMDAGYVAVDYWAISTAWKTLRGNEPAGGRWMMNLFNTKSKELVRRVLGISS